MSIAEQEYPDIVGMKPDSPASASFEPFIPAATSLRELTGHGGFMFAEQPTHLRQSHLLRIVAGHAQTVLRGKHCQDDGQRCLHQADEPQSSGILRHGSCDECVG